MALMVLFNLFINITHLLMIFGDLANNCLFHDFFLARCSLLQMRFLLFATATGRCFTMHLFSDTFLKWLGFETSIVLKWLAGFERMLVHLLHSLLGFGLLTSLGLRLRMLYCVYQLLGRR